MRARPLIRSLIRGAIYSLFTGWKGVNIFAPISGLGDLSGGLYTDFTMGTLVPERGPTFSITRATASTTEDFEGLVKPILSGEARFRKLRRVENLAMQSENGQGWDSAGTTPPTLAQGVTHLATTCASVTFSSASAVGFAGSRIQRNSITTTAITAGRTDNLNEYISISRALTGAESIETYWTGSEGMGGFVINASNSAQFVGKFLRVSRTKNWTVTGGVYPVISLEGGVGSDVTVYITRVQAENVTGQANQNPGEYISTGVLASPFHGAGVDGVKYFNTANGNTVASNVVTEATGASLTLTGAVGIDPYGAATNVVLHNRDLTNAAWVKGATATVAKDQTGADGLPNGASSFTGGATFATNTVLQAIVLASSARSQEVFVKRLVGTGTIEMTTDGGTTWVVITTTASYTKLRIPVQTLADPSVGFRITTLNDKIAVDYVTNTSVVNAPVVATTTAAVTVNADVITADGTNVINQTKGTLYVEAVGPVDAGDRALFETDDGTTSEYSQLRSLAGQAGLVIRNAAGTQVNTGVGTWSAGAVGKVAGRYRLNDSNIAFNGAAGTVDTTCAMPSTTTFRIGYSSAGYEPNTTIRRIAYSLTGATDAGLTEATT